VDASLCTLQKLLERILCSHPLSLAVLWVPLSLQVLDTNQEGWVLVGTPSSEAHGWANPRSGNYAVASPIGHRGESQARLGPDFDWR
jgi:hypothetical protein